jgi:hypothetical protein
VVRGTFILTTDFVDVHLLKRLVELPEERVSRVDR